MSRDCGRSTRRRAARLAVLVLSLALPGSALRAAQAQEPPAPEVPEAVQRELQAAQDGLARAIAEFDGPQQSRSIVAFDDVARRLEGLGPRALPASGRDILAQAYEYRGRAYFGIGLSEKASENFRQLVQLKPDYRVSRDRVSPKVVELFTSVQRSLVGFLTVSSRPAGARVTLVALGRRAQRPRFDRLLPPRGPGRRLHGRDRASPATRRRRGRSASPRRPRSR